MEMRGYCPLMLLREVARTPEQPTTTAEAKRSLNGDSKRTRTLTRHPRTPDPYLFQMSTPLALRVGGNLEGYTI